MDLIVATPEGLYCPPGDFYIDPWRAVRRAVITHGHADHARFGSDAYFCHRLTAPVLRRRLGAVACEAVDYGATTLRNGVNISLHPAGHIPGSAQVRVAYGGEVWVVSGDYKIEADGASAPFEPVTCHAFISESTFGLPIYRWPDAADVGAEINRWWAENAEARRASVIYAYALGKAQRILRLVDPSIGPIFCHGAIEPINEIYRDAGISLPSVSAIAGVDKATFARALIVAPPSAAGGPWLRRFGPCSDAFASGWMQVRGNRRRRGVDRGFVLSDHADWTGLLGAIDATGAQRIFLTHGFVQPLTRYLCERGLDARPMKTEYGDDGQDEIPGAGVGLTEQEES
jgi:putative mRNA 3-end processing factor